MNRWWILFGTLLAIPVVVCISLFAGFLIAASVAENEYERRAQAVVATALERAGPNPTQISISEAALDSGFRALPEVLLFDAGHVRFLVNYDRIQAKGQGFLGSYLSYLYRPVISDSGELRLIPMRLAGIETSFDTLGYSDAGVGSAIEKGINQALAEAGVRPTALKARGEKLTIELEPIN
jgi:hypothetical protein